MAISIEEGDGVESMKFEVDRYDTDLAIQNLRVGWYENRRGVVAHGHLLRSLVVIRWSRFLGRERDGGGEDEREGERGRGGGREIEGVESGLGG